MAEPSRDSARPTETDKPARGTPQRENPQSKHRHPWLRRLTWLLVSLVLLLALAVGALWVWSGSSGSLAFVLERAAPYLPSGQQLQTEGVRGSLRSGGHIDRLVWQSEGLDAEVNNIDIGWNLAPLLDKQVSLSKVDVASVVLTPKATPDKPDEPMTPIEKLELPVQIDVPFSIDRLVWAGPPQQVVQALHGRYRYDGTEHALDVAGADVPHGPIPGHVQGKIRLQGAAPMALAAQVEATLKAPLPDDGRTLDVSVLANAKGTLAGQTARIQVDAKLQQLLAPARPGGPGNRATVAKPPLESGTGAMGAQLTATLAPWAKQPLETAQATLDNVNTAALVAGAPRTLLSGTVDAGPTEDGWAIDAQLHNAVPSPIDKGTVPVDSANLQARFDGSMWSVTQALIRAGTGTIALRGTFTPDNQVFDAQAEVAQLDPSYLHTQLEAAPVAGTLSAKGSAQDLRFEAALAASAAGTSRAASAVVKGPLRIDRVAARGRWNHGVLTMANAELDALRAKVRASDVRVATQPKLSVQAKADAAVPGARLTVDGHIAESTGQGALQLQLSDAQDTLAWLRTLPWLEQLAPGLAARGTARLDAHWNGGWANLGAVPDSKPTTPRTRAGAALNTGIKARLSSPRLQLDIPQGDGVESLNTDVRDLLLTADGNASNADIKLKAEVRQGKRRLSLDSALQAGVAQAEDGKTITARADIEKLSLRALDGIRKGPWTVKLSGPVSVDYAKAESGTMTIKAGAASAAVGAPVPGTVAMQWQPIVVEQTAAGTVTVQSKGSISGVPIAWVDLAVADPDDSPLKKFGVDSNLVFAGEWDIRATDTLNAQLKIQRSSGDLRMAVNGAAPPTSIKSTGATGASTPSAAPRNTIAAGLKTLDLTVNTVGNDVRAELVWDSERAGVLRADVGTTLARQGGGWTLPENAPLSGKVRAQLPKLGIFSIVAPPGWRINGALDADVALSGTIPDPRWQGTLRADGLAVQSLLDGVDLKNGSVLAELQGNRIDVSKFHLEGGSASSARILGFSGNLTPPPTDGGALDGSGTVQWGAGRAADGANGDTSLRMDFKVRAKSLQVLARADRQASVSGTLDASLVGKQFKLRGDLKIDRASITLPEAGAPSLGDDVVVRSKALDKQAQKNLEKQIKDKAAAAAEAAKGPRAAAALPPDLVVTLDLGNDFALQGFGIKTRLEGKLTIRGAAEAGAPPSVMGEIRTVAGRYRAWGQSLDVETGLIQFGGPYDNPSLDILALRPNIEVRAGVAVTGTARNPRIRLYSEPQMPDAEKLSWVVLGRSTASGGAEAAVLQQAALALLSGGSNTDGNIASKFGLDEIGFKGPNEGANGAALTFGKRLSKDLYVTYEKSLSGTLGSLYIFYDLTKRLRLRGQTGADTGLDLIYTIRYE